MSQNAALNIVQVAKTNRLRAEKLALSLIRKIAPQLKVTAATINQSKLSLNSVNGFLVAGDKKYFFKFHAEENEVEGLKNTEYYNAKLLSDYGWPVIQPIFSSHEPGSQFVIYDYIDAPTAFDAYEAQEVRRIDGKEYEKDRLDDLFKTERQLCAKVREGFLKSLEMSDKSVIDAASLNQLFYKRLVGTAGSPPRLEQYYSNKKLQLPNGESLAFNELSKMRWVINGIRYEESLEDVIVKSKDLLNPEKEDRAATVIGHGDDHNGNRFIINGEYVFFDPAFAGRQPALLSFIKATAHNVFVHPFWLYDPKKLEGRLKLKASVENGVISVKHNLALNQLSPLRLEILEIYINQVWKPLIQELATRKLLPPYWKDYMRAALFCCPFLVLNLIDPNKYTPEQSILALSKSIELGSKATMQNIVEQFLTDISPKDV